MTEAITIREMFEGRPIQVIENKGQFWFRLEDLAAAWGTDRTTPHNLIKRNQPLFEGMTNYQIDGDITSQDGEFEAVNERGLYTLIGKISADRLKNKKAGAAILRFQRWVPELIEKHRKNEMQIQAKLPEKVGENWSSVAIEHLNFAKGLAANNPHLDQGMILAIGIRSAEKATGMDLSAYKKLIPPVADQPSAGEVYITASQIGREIGEYRTAEEVNRYLEMNGYLWRAEDGTYYLTDAGAQHGKVFPGAFSSGHVGYYIKWKRSIISAAKIRENNPRKIRD